MSNISSTMYVLQTMPNSLYYLGLPMTCGRYNFIATPDEKEAAREIKKT